MTEQTNKQTHNINNMMKKKNHIIKFKLTYIANQMEFRVCVRKIPNEANN